MATSRSGWEKCESVSVLTSDRRVHQRGHVGVDTLPGVGGGVVGRLRWYLGSRNTAAPVPYVVCRFIVPPCVYPCSLAA